MGGIRAVPLDASPAAVARMKKYVPPAYAHLYKPSPVNTGVLQPTYIMSYDYLMLTNTKVPDEVVYQVLKAMHDNPQELAASFPALKSFSPEHMAKAFESKEIGRAHV